VVGVVDALAVTVVVGTGNTHDGGVTTRWCVWVTTVVLVCVVEVPFGVEAFGALGAVVDAPVVMLEPPAPVDVAVMLLVVLGAAVVDVVDVVATDDVDVAPVVGGAVDAEDAESGANSER
jgi:hypothetical protein